MFPSSSKSVWNTLNLGGNANHLQKRFTPSVLRQKRTTARVQLLYGNSWGTGSPTAGFLNFAFHKVCKKWKNFCKQLITIQTTHKSAKKPQPHSFQSILWLHAGLPAARKKPLSKKLIPKPFEPQPRWLSRLYFTSYLGFFSSFPASPCFRCKTMYKMHFRLNDSPWKSCSSSRRKESPVSQALYDICHFCFMDTLIIERKAIHLWFYNVTVSYQYCSIPTVTEEEAQHT